ncbi:MAG: hypothetical protein HYW07_04310 [Candidatus Latescibacteria bacterium]|nr:hypothetical protein [Candidatus Latescibacterota bacterium]
MKPASRTPDLPKALKIGTRFLLSFEGPDAAGPPYHGRLQEWSADGCLCIDAPSHFQPQRGTPVTLQSLDPKSYSFSSEVMGYNRLKGRLPVLLVKPPRRLEEQPRPRSAYRISACLRAQAKWAEQDETLSAPGVVANLSGGGAQIFLRRKPTAQALSLELALPQEFIEEAARRQLTRNGPTLTSAALFRELFHSTCERIRNSFALQARIVHVQVRQTQQGPIYALSLAFAAPHEGCFRLVSFLERQALRKGVTGAPDSRRAPPLAKVA